MTLPFPEKPMLVYDGNCDFCRYWIERWKQLTHGTVEYEPFQTAAEQFPHVSLEQFSRSVYLFMPSGEAFRGAEAVAESLAGDPHYSWMLWVYRHLPFAAPISEWVYRFVARHREGLFTITRFLLGNCGEDN
jgi:lipase maturation factor 1